MLRVFAEQRAATNEGSATPDRRPRARAQHEGYEPHRAAQLFVRFSYELERDAVTH